MQVKILSGKWKDQILETIRSNDAENNAVVIIDNIRVILQEDEYEIIPEKHKSIGTIGFVGQGRKGIQSTILEILRRNNVN